MMLIVVELINDARPEIIGTTFKAIATGVQQDVCMSETRIFTLVLTQVSFLLYVKDKPSFWPGVEKCLRVRIFLQVVGGGGDMMKPPQ